MTLEIISDGSAWFFLIPVSMGFSEEALCREILTANWVRFEIPLSRYRFTVDRNFISSLKTPSSTTGLVVYFAVREEDRLKWLRWHSVLGRVRISTEKDATRFDLQLVRNNQISEINLWEIEKPPAYVPFAIPSSFLFLQGDPKGGI